MASARGFLHLGLLAASLGFAGRSWCAQSVPIEVASTEYRASASYHADGKEVRLELTRIGRPGDGVTRLRFSRDGTTFYELEAHAFHPHDETLIVLEAIVSGHTFSVVERNESRSFVMATDSADVEISSGSKAWVKSRGGLHGAPSFGSTIPQEVARSIAPFFQYSNVLKYAGPIQGQLTIDSLMSTSTVEPGHGNGSFPIFLKDVVGWPGDIGCSAAELAIGLAFEGPTAEALGEQFCRALQAH